MELHTYRFRGAFQELAPERIASEFLRIHASSLPYHFAFLINSLLLDQLPLL